MGRGLSELQKGILRLAYQNRLEIQAVLESSPGEARWISQEDVYPHLVLGELYGFSEHTVTDDWTGKPQDWSRLRHYRHKQKFDRDKIGHARYGSATSATKKALERLEKRGLLIQAGWGYRLTETGLAVAESLMAENVDNCTQSQPLQEE